MAEVDAAVLTGTRVLDLTHAWAGPFATQLLADYGAEVIKIETCDRPDMLRFSTWSPAEARPEAYNRGGWFQYLGRNKLGLTLDLKHPQGRALFERLAAQSDVVIENFSARVMRSLGLEYESLRALNSQLIMVSMPGFGSTGPYKDFVAFGEMIEPFAGLSELTGYPDRAPLRIAVAYPDPVAGFHAALAVLLALRQRRHTGVGQHLYVPHREPITRMLGRPSWTIRSMVARHAARGTATAPGPRMAVIRAVERTDGSPLWRAPTRNGRHCVTSSWTQSGRSIRALPAVLGVGSRRLSSTATSGRAPVTGGIQPGRTPARRRRPRRRGADEWRFAE